MDTYDRLAALRASLYDNIWLMRVEGALLSVFNELLAAAKKISPNDRVLKAIDPSPAVVGVVRMRNPTTRTGAAAERRHTRRVGRPEPPRDQRLGSDPRDQRHGSVEIR
jgi:hypothetical protein